MDPRPNDVSGPLAPRAESQPLAERADHTPDTLGGWFRANWLKLAVTVALIAAVTKYLHPIDVLLAAGGLSLIIFLHELGHFAAAKLCDVHVRTFSIGFGPALPFCRFQYGETTYKLAMIPLGGYVAMVGEGEEEGDIVEGAIDPEEAVNDPRSFKNKTVLQRMFVISAGVIMNLILGCVCFVVSYLHGVQESPAIATHVEPGSAAWRAGIHSGSEITRLNGRVNPWFDDIRPIVSSTSAGETVDLEVRFAGAARPLTLEPLRPEGALFPQLGITPPSKLVLPNARRGDATPPYGSTSPAAGAKAADGGAGFRHGDEIVGMTDPDAPDTVTALAAKPEAGLPTPYFDYERRLRRLAANPATAGKPISFQVTRRGESTPQAVTMTPGFRQTTGLRMRMGPVAAVRAGSPADGKVRPRQTDGDKVIAPGDRIVSVEVIGPDSKVSRFGGEGGEPLDPLKLPFQLIRWAESLPKGFDPAVHPVKVEVLREGENHTEEKVSLALPWDRAYEYDMTQPMMSGSPTPVPGLGLAYQVLSVVDGVEKGSAAEKAGLQPNDRITDVRFKALGADGEVKTGSWEPVPPHHWAFADFKLQLQPPHAFEAKIERGGTATAVELAASQDTTWPTADTGLLLLADTRTQQAATALEALEMGAYRTTRSIHSIYLQLYALASGRISVTLMSGPITLARASYLLAGEDVWKLILFLGLISVNLAVVNFLPIPVLDGGHMMFLLYEGIRGRPAPDWLHAGLTYAGLAVVGCLMLFVLGLDIWRLF